MDKHVYCYQFLLAIYVALRFYEGIQSWAYVEAIKRNEEKCFYIKKGVTLLLNCFADLRLVDGDNAIWEINWIFCVFERYEGFCCCICKDQFQDEKLTDQD